MHQKQCTAHSGEKRPAASIWKNCVPCVFFCFGTCAIIKHKGKLIPQAKQLPVKIDIFLGELLAPRGASMRQPRPCDVKREEKRQYIDAKEKAKKRQSRNHVAGVEPTQWPHCNGTWIDRYISLHHIQIDGEWYPIISHPNKSHEIFPFQKLPPWKPFPAPSRAPRIGPSTRQEQRHLESIWPVGDPGGFHGEIWWIAWGSGRWDAMDITSIDSIGTQWDIYIYNIYI